MKVLVISDLPIKTGMHYEILDRIFTAYGVQWVNEPVFQGMTEKEVKKVKPAQWKERTEALHYEARSYDKVLCCGSIAAAAFFRAEKGVTVTKVRGRSYIHQLLNSKRQKHTVITFSPYTCIKDPDFFRDFRFDVCKLLDNDGPLPQPQLEIHLVERAKDLSLLSDLHTASFLGCDTETTGLSPFKSMVEGVPPDILGIGFCALTENDEGYAIVVPQKYIGDKVHKFLRTYKGTLVFHNLKFDVQHLWKKYGRFDFHSLGDTMMLGWCLDERPFNRYKHLNLDLLQRLHFDAPPKSVRMVEWLEEYFRTDVGDEMRWEYIEEFCAEHPEKARTLWRLAVCPEDQEWRGKKVGRDIPIEVVAPYIPLPRGFAPAPDKVRREEMWEAMMRYMGEDCHSTARLWPILRKEAEEESERLLFLHDRLLIPASLALANMEMTGAPVNLPYLQEMKETIDAQLDEEIVYIRALVQEHTNHPKGEDFNPNSPQQVEQLLYNATDEGGLGLAMPKDVGRYAYKRDEGEVTTNADTLKVLARQCSKDMPAAAKLINYILSYRVKSKIIGTYVEGILERVDDDGRIRGDFNLHGTATGRLSCSNPNLQNIPDASHVGFDVRKAYIPSDGWVIMEADYSQLELRIAGLFSQDEVLIEAYENGADIHQEVALMLWNKPKDKITKYERYLAKCMNFGVLYGRGAKSIATGPEMDNLVEMSGRSWSMKEIDAYFAKFKVGYVDLFNWMDVLKGHAFPLKYVEGPFGNRRRWPLALKKDSGGIQRQIVNSPIQGFAAQVTLNALIELDKVFDPKIQRILFTVHDSIMCECLDREDVIEETGELIRTVMENNLPQGLICPFPTLPHAPFSMGDEIIYNIPFIADVSYGQSWGECKNEIEAREEEGVNA